MEFDDNKIKREKRKKENMRLLLQTLLQIFVTSNAKEQQQKQQQTHGSHHLFVKVGIKITMLKRTIRERRNICVPHCFRFISFENVKSLLRIPLLEKNQRQ